MDIVLGVSLTPKTVRLVLVEGVAGDGKIVDHDTFDVTPSDEAATSSASSQVVAAVQGTLESAREGGHQLKAIGVTWSDHEEASKLRDALAAAGVDDAILVSELHAAGALAQTAGRAVGYESTALLFLDRDAATLSVVRTDDGSIVKVLSRSLHSTDAMAVLADMASAVAAQETPPEGMFVVGAGVDVASVKSHLQDLVSIPVNAPEESGLALARGAAIAAANAPTFDASTVGLAYSQDPDGATAGNDYPALSSDATQLRLAGTAAPLAADLSQGLDDDFGDAPAEEGRKPFLLVGSALTSVFVIGVIALVISLAVSIRPTADQRPDPGQSAIIPSAAAPVAPLPEIAQPPAPAPAPAPAAPATAPAPPAETIKAPIPVVQEEQAPRRQVYVAPAPQAPPAPVPDPPAAPPLPPPPPVVAPPVPAVIAPLVPRIFSPPVQQYPQYPQYGQYPQQQYPQYPQQQYPQQQPPWQQQPQNPWQQGPSRGDDGWPGSRGHDGRPGRGGHGGGGGGSNCFLIFCAPAGGGGDR